MTVYEIMKAIGKWEEFEITMNGVDITQGHKARVADIDNDSEERNVIWDAMEANATIVNIEEKRVYCEY